MERATAEAERPQLRFGSLPEVAHIRRALAVAIPRECRGDDGKGRAVIVRATASEQCEGLRKQPHHGQPGSQQAERGLFLARAHLEGKVAQLHIGSEGSWQSVRRSTLEGMLRYSRRVALAQGNQA